MRMHGEKTTDIVITSPEELIEAAMPEIDEFVRDGVKTIGEVAGEYETDMRPFELFNPVTKEVLVSIIPDNTGFVFLTNYKGRDVSGHVNKAISDDIDFDTLINSMDEIFLGERLLNVNRIRNLLKTDNSGSTEEFDIESYKLQYIFIYALILVLSVLVNLKQF